jgi:predicted dehydrogenase
VIVSTSTNFLPQIALALLEAGKHVLCEKPFGRNAAEVLPAVEVAERSHLCLKVGYNHRYHPAIEKAHTLFEQHAIGRLHFLRCVYGHGGRAGYGQEWRTHGELSGGGQLLDQGVHVLDLFRWFAGDFSEVKAYMRAAFWPIAPLEDNVFALLRNDRGCLASLHASWTNWKNSFVFEVFGDAGYLAVNGLGGHYGTERLSFGTRGDLGTTPKEEFFDFPDADHSLAREWEDFVDCIRQGRTPQSDGRDAWKTLQLAEAVYREANTGGTTTAEIHGVSENETPAVRRTTIYEMNSAQVGIGPSIPRQPRYKGENLR